MLNDKQSRKYNTKTMLPDINITETVIPVANTLKQNIQNSSIDLITRDFKYFIIFFF